MCLGNAHACNDYDYGEALLISCACILQRPDEADNSDGAGGERAESDAAEGRPAFELQQQQGNTLAIRLSPILPGELAQYTQYTAGKHAGQIYSILFYLVKETAVCRQHDVDACCVPLQAF